MFKPSATARLSLCLLAFLLLLGLAGTPFQAQAASLDLEYAYVRSSRGLFTVGEEVRFEVVVPDAKGLIFQFIIYHNDQPGSNQFTGVGMQEASDSPNFSYVPTQTGRYFLTVSVWGEQMAALELRSMTYSCYAQGEEARPGSLPHRVGQIVQQARASRLQDDYETALFLHDWLTTNAEYDESYTHYEPEGVLLHGRGVCDSYARAYQILLKEMGIESLFVSGTSRGQPHSWNLVRLGGQWTWVDVTWDDPVPEPGFEISFDSHAYFGLNDLLMARDHDWSQGRNKPPKATTLDYHHGLRTGARGFYDQEGMMEVISAGLAARQPTVHGLYLGADPSFPVLEILQTWLNSGGIPNHVRSMQAAFPSEFSFLLELSYD